MQKQIAKDVGAGPVSAHKIGNTQKGITLIALVITIIVLLILAGVTINIVLGDDGIIAQAQESKLSQKEGRLKEAIELYKAEKELAARGGEAARPEDEFFKDLYDEKLVEKEFPHTIYDRTRTKILYVHLINFTISDLPNVDGGYTYQAEEGMTWEDWKDSIYNTITLDDIWEGADVSMRTEFREVKINGYEYYGNFVEYHNTYGARYLAYNGKLVTASTVISDNYVYSGLDTYGYTEENLPAYTFKIDGVEFTSDKDIYNWQEWTQQSAYNTDSYVSYDSMGFVVANNKYINLDGVYPVAWFSDKPEYGKNYSLSEENPYYIMIDGTKYRIPHPQCESWWSGFIGGEFDTTGGLLQYSDDGEHVSYDGKTLYLDGEKVLLYSSIENQKNYTTSND